MISDVKISGNIAVPETNSGNVYIGAIAGYNGGIINNCYEDTKYTTPTVRSVSPSSVENNNIVIGNETGILLSGEYENVSIQIANSGLETPAYIIFDNAQLTGTIYSDTDRPIYLISTGSSNSITASNDAIAVNAQKSEVSIFANTELIVTGGNGTRGADGARGGEGENGSPGKSGTNGGIGIKSYALYIIYSNDVRIIGGDGGNGGNGGAGNNKDLPFAAAKNGGKGGNGGEGAYAALAEEIHILNSNAEFVGGNGGTGGNGGARGEYGANEGNPGNGGNGGNGGDAIAYKNLKTYNIETLKANGGVGGSGGSGNSKGTTGNNGVTLCSLTNGNGYQLFNGNAYQLLREQLTWEEARLACEELGGHLVTITSAEENAFLTTLVSGNSAWIGVSDVAQEGTWVWVTGEEFSYTNWGSGEPNNSGNEDYAHFSKTSTGKWNDTSSTSKLYYICEYEKFDYGYETIVEGKIRSLNSELWNNNNLQITSVSKTEYFSGDTFDTATVEVELYDKLISDYGKSFDFACRGIALSKMGYVKVTKDTYERYIPVHITKTIPEYIEVSEVGKTEFAVGEAFDISGLTVKVVYNNGSIQHITEADPDISYTIPKIEYANQTEEVVVTYQESGLYFSASYEIKTVADTVESIFIQSPAIYLTYKQGDELRLDGLEVYEIRRSGKTDLLDNKYLTFEVSPSLCNVGISTVTIIHPSDSDITTTYTVTVSANKNFEHPWDNGETTIYPTHTSEGVKTYHCTIDNCSATKTASIPTLDGHAYGDWYKLNDTQHQRICECGDTITMEHEWNSGVTTTPATHLTYGESLHACSVCNATETRRIEKTAEHAFNNWSKYNDIQHSHSCECGETEHENHNWSSSVVTLQPTYTTDGIMTYTCSDCGYEKTESIPAIGTENAPTIVIESAPLVAGNTVTVRISLKNNPGIASMKFVLTYDTEILTLVDIEYNSAIGGMSQQPSNYNSPVILNWINGTSNSNGDFLFATLTFTVSSDAVSGETTKLSLSYDKNDIYDISETNIDFFAPDYDALIIDYVPGDINSDGVVNNKDVTRLFQYLSDWDVEVNSSALDVNGDGSVNNKDLTRLFQYTSGWEVELY